MLAKPKKPTTVKGYIATHPTTVQDLLNQMRSIIKTEAPDAEETLSYGMPAYKWHGVLVYFAAFKNHIGFYATPNGNVKFQKQLSAYKTGKGSIQFPIDKPLPSKLIADIVKFRVSENLQKVNASKRKDRKI